MNLTVVFYFLYLNKHMTGCLQTPNVYLDDVLHV